MNILKLVGRTEPYLMTILLDMSQCSWNWLKTRFLVVGVLAPSAKSLMRFSAEPKGTHVVDLSENMWNVRDIRTLGYGMAISAPSQSTVEAPHLTP